jgi:hypothetical protein
MTNARDVEWYLVMSVDPAPVKYWKSGWIYFLGSIEEALRIISVAFLDLGAPCKCRFE